MGDEMMSDAPLGGLWVRRQVFEHSVAVPLLTSASAAQIDFTKLAQELAACSVYMNTEASHRPPAVSYSDWVAMAGLHARLDSSDDACVIIEALETNAPEAFVRCNDPEKLAPGRQLNYRHLNIPVPELLAFLRLHAAATLASRFRETCQAQWPDSENSGNGANGTGSGGACTGANGDNGSGISGAADTNSGTDSPRTALNRPALSILPVSHTGTSPTSPTPTPVGTLSPLSPRVAQRHGGAGTGGPMSPLMGTPAGNVPPGSPVGGSGSPSGGMDGLVRKKTPASMGGIKNSASSILASVAQSYVRETELVSRNITHLLEVIAACYGVVVSSKKKGDDSMAGTRGTAAETGRLVRVNSDRRRGDTWDARRAAVRDLEVTREMFEHLSFLLTTNVSEAGARRSIAAICGGWRSGVVGKMRLGDLVDTVRAALIREPSRDEAPIDVAELVSLDKKTVLRTEFPDCNEPGDSYPHGREVRIADCTSSQLYLLAALGRVTLVACRDCTLFVGACVSVSLINCVNVSVHAVARVCRVTNCFDAQLYLFTNRPPQIVGDNRGLVFAPYNAVYSDVVRDMAAIGVVSSSNRWDAFYRPAYRTHRGVSAKSDPDLTPAVATVLAPEKFFPFAVPVKTITSTHTARGLFSLPLTLPPEYAAGLAARKHEIDLVRREIRTMDASLTTTNDDSTGMLQTIVQERFREWLITTGNIRQIAELTRMESEANPDLGLGRAKTPERSLR